MVLIASDWKVKPCFAGFNGSCKHFLGKLFASSKGFLLCVKSLEFISKIPAKILWSKPWTALFLWRRGFEIIAKSHLLNLGDTLSKRYTRYTFVAWNISLQLRMLKQPYFRNKTPFFKTNNILIRKPCKKQFKAKICENKVLDVSDYCLHKQLKIHNSTEL